MRLTGNMRTPCPTCGYGLQGKPYPSGVIVCVNCGAWLLPAGESTLRAVTQTEAEQLPPAVQSTLIKASRLILQTRAIHAPIGSAAR